MEFCILIGFGIVLMALPFIVLAINVKVSKDTDRFLSHIQSIGCMLFSIGLVQFISNLFGF